MIRRCVLILAGLLPAILPGCSPSAEPGNVVVTSTADLGKVGVGRSPAPVVPGK